MVTDSKHFEVHIGIICESTWLIAKHVKVLMCALKTVKRAAPLCIVYVNHTINQMTVRHRELMEWSINHQGFNQWLTVTLPFSLCVSLSLSLSKVPLEKGSFALPLKVYPLHSPPVESPHYWKMFHLPFSSRKFNIKKEQPCTRSNHLPSPLKDGWTFLRCYWTLAHHLILHYYSNPNGIVHFPNSRVHLFWTLIQHPIKMKRLLY